MTYKEAHDLFYLKYNQIKPCLLGFQEILLYLSEAQSELQNRYNLTEYISTLKLTKNQDKYSTGTGEDNIPDDIKNIIKVSGLTSTGEFTLEETSYDLMKNTEKIAGYPQKYTVYKFGKNSQILEIDTYPDKSYSEDNNYLLTILYYPKFGIYTGSTGTFSDLDFSKSDWGGSFKLPDEWHPIIVEGALSKVFPDRLQNYYAMILEQLPNKPKPFDTELKYHLGI